MATPDAPPRPAAPRRLPVIDDFPRYHRARKLTHLICFLIFVALPFFNWMRFDIPRQRFYFAGYELWINEFGIIFFTLMFLMFVIVASSVVYGRVYCGYLCPQMIFSESSIYLEDWIKRKVNKHLSKWPAARRKLAARLAWLAIIAAASVVLAFVFIAYFVEPRDLLARLMSLDLQTAGGISGAVVTLIAFLDFTLVRDCIECKKCIRVCHMGIDIRESPFQIECVHCGECIDACNEILGKLGKPGLIHYTWGETGNIVETETSWYKKLGLRDAKRVVVMLVTLFYLSGLSIALSMRRPLLVQLQPVRTTMYRLGDEGTVYNRFRIKLANRGSADARVHVAVEGLPGAVIALEANPLMLKPGESVEREFEIAARPFQGSRDVNPFRITVASAGQDAERFDETFIMPPEGTTH
ncbi:MAG: 4Fe-4S binding protein [Acidobacteria bacterium]|nr:4Fe-4S binding protein [Acidobacteriota bacterium]